MANYTFKDFMIECESYEYSRENYELMKECSELNLMAQYIENQQYIIDNGVLLESTNIDLSSYYVTEAETLALPMNSTANGGDTASAEEAIANKKPGFWGSFMNKAGNIVKGIGNALKKAWGGFIKFLKSIGGWFAQIFKKTNVFSLNKQIKELNDELNRNKEGADLLITKLQQENDELLKDKKRLRQELTNRNILLRGVRNNAKNTEKELNNTINKKDDEINSLNSKIGNMNSKIDRLYTQFLSIGFVIGDVAVACDKVINNFEVRFDGKTGQTFNAWKALCNRLHTNMHIAASSDGTDYSINIKEACAFIDSINNNIPVKFVKIGNSKGAYLIDINLLADIYVQMDVAIDQLEVVKDAAGNDTRKKFSNLGKLLSNHAKKLHEFETKANNSKGIDMVINADNIAKSLERCAAAGDGKYMREPVKSDNDHYTSKDRRIMSDKDLTDKDFNKNKDINVSASLSHVTSQLQRLIKVINNQVAQHMRLYNDLKAIHTCISDNMPIINQWKTTTND